MIISATPTNLPLNKPGKVNNRKGSALGDWILNDPVSILKSVQLISSSFICNKIVFYNYFIAQICILTILII